MRILITAIVAALVLAVSTAASTQHAVAQATSSAQSQPATSPAPAPLTKDVEGMEVFTSDKQGLGKVTKANAAADGKLKDIEIQSAGYFGFFRTTYVVPIDKASVKSGRVELSMTNDQAQTLAK